jgi:hypothetical protein
MFKLETLHWRLRQRQRRQCGSRRRSGFKALQRFETGNLVLEHDPNPALAYAPEPDVEAIVEPEPQPEPLEPAQDTNTQLAALSACITELARQAGVSLDDQ